MNCPKCQTLMTMTVQIGVQCPSELEGQFTKGMFRRKDVSITHANWETARYYCPQCNHVEGGYGNYITKLEDTNAELKLKVKELEKRITVENWYVKDKKDHGLL